MKPKLPRALLWTELETMEDFFKEPVNVKLYEYYLELRSMTVFTSETRRPLKLFNEIYYQLTRFEYENNINFNIGKYIQDIKANIGSLYGSMLVLRMIYAFLSIRNNNPQLTRFLMITISEKINQYNNHRSIKLLPNNEFLKQSYTVDLKPRPRKVIDLDGEILSWYQITNVFDRESIEEVINLWPSNKEKYEVLKLIERSYSRNYHLIAKRLNHYYAISTTATPDFFSDLYAKIGYPKEKVRNETEDLIASPSYLDLAKDNMILKKKISSLESENERLMSERNPNRAKKNRERAFTLSMIADYCKKRLNSEKASVIVAMLNNFLRDARDYTKEECDLVDSIEIECLSKKYGDTVMGDKNEFFENSAHNTIELPSGMTAQEAMKLLQSKAKEDGEKGLCKR